MRWQALIPMALILLPAAALASMGCGILLFPIEGPKVAIVNSKTISFTVDIVDEADQPLNDVTVTVTEEALQADPLVVQRIDSKLKPALHANGSLSYKTFGSYAVFLDFAKPGYAPRQCVYSCEDQVERVAPIGRPQMQINTLKEPHSKIVLKKIRT